MADHNHTGSIWGNVSIPVNRRSGPGTDFAIIDTLEAGKSLIVLCYSLGDTESFTASNGQRYTSNAWDFVVKDDQDPGGYVADVFVNTGGDITQMLGEQGRCDVLAQRFALPGRM